MTLSITDNQRTINKFNQHDDTNISYVNIITNYTQFWKKRKTTIPKTILIPVYSKFFSNWSFLINWRQNIIIEIYKWKEYIRIKSLTKSKKSSLDMKFFLSKVDPISMEKYQFEWARFEAENREYIWNLNLTRRYFSQNKFNTTWRWNKIICIECIQIKWNLISFEKYPPQTKWSEITPIKKKKKIDYGQWY